MRAGTRARMVWIGIACVVVACAEAPRPLRPGEAVIERPGEGMIFGRVAMMRDGEDRMTSLPTFPLSFGWALVHAETGKKFVIDPLTGNGLFAVSLPTGIFHVTKLWYKDRYGEWEGLVAASFIVKSGWIYIGTWELTFAGLGSEAPITAVTRNDLKAEHEDFEIQYGINPQPVKVELLQSTPKGYLNLLRPRAEQ